MSVNIEDSAAVSGALSNALEKCATSHLGGYYHAWPDGTVSVELDSIPLEIIVSHFLDGLGMTQSIEAIFRSARQRLDSAYFGLADMRERSGTRFQSGLMNAVVFGRMVTFHLQNLRGKAEGWDEWYEERQAEMKADPLMRYFVDLRNTIEKRAENVASIQARIHSFDDGSIARFQPKPPGATSLVIGSTKYGGASGWLVPANDGSEVLYVIDLPPDIGEVKVSLEAVPADYAHEKADNLVEKYLSNLAELLDAATAKFCP